MPEQPTSDTTPSTPDASTAAPDAAQPAPQPVAQPAAQPVLPAPQGPGTEAPKAPGSKRKRILSALGTVVVLLAVKFGLGYMLADKPAADTLSIGQCVQRGDDDTINAVDCKDGKAQYKVVFIAKDTKEAQADQTCAPYEATTMTYFESGKGDETGNTICLGPVG